MNQVFLLGRLTADPQMKKISDHDFVDCQVAVKRKYRNADGEYESDFIRCVAWNKTAELIGRMKKGEQIALVGSLQVRKYEDQQGNKKTMTEILVDEIDFIGQKLKENPEQVSILQPLDDDMSEGLPF